MTRVKWVGLAIVMVQGLVRPGFAATYYVDYANGDNTADGLGPERAWKHSPGDDQATGTPAALELKSGDRVRFRGGVRYRGTIRPNASGLAGAPIVFDGNRDGTWGEGPALVDGSEPVGDWRPLASAEEARGNENWRRLRVAALADDTEARLLNLTQGSRFLSVARDPPSADPFYLDDRGTMRSIQPPQPEDRGRAAIDSSRLFSNRNHPLRLMVDGQQNTLAIIEPMKGARLDFIIPETAKVTRLALTTCTRPTRAREIRFLADGKVVLTKTLPNEAKHMEFPLDEPVSFQKLTLEILSVYDGGQRYGGMRRVQAFDAGGNDVLRVIEKGGGDPHAVYADERVFTQSDPHYWDGASFAIHAGNNHIFYRRVLGYDPARHEIRTEPIAEKQYPGNRGRFAMVNVLGAIQAPGQFYVDPTPDAEGRRRLVVWPFEEDGARQEISVARRPAAFVIEGQHHVVVEGFRIQKHGPGFAIEMKDSDHVTVRGNELLLNGGGAIQAVTGEGVRIGNNHIHLNRGRGIRLHTIAKAVVTGNRLHRNGATGIGLYVCRDAEVTYNHVTGHRGVHANALTVYADSKNILLEGNRTLDNNNGLTMQDVEKVVVRNNFLHSSGTVVGLWTGYHREVRFEHNAIIGLENRPRNDWAGAIFTNGTVEGLHVHNNILAGTSGRLPGTYSHNLYTRIGRNDHEDNLPEGSRYLPDLNAIFVDPATGDYRIKAGSPVLGAGTRLGVEKDIDGNPRPEGAPAIGPYGAAVHQP